MDIVIVGCGKVGYTIAKQLSEESDNNITIIDKKASAFEKIAESIDVMTIKGNCLSSKTLNDVHIKTVDLIICVTSTDETNILCCLTAKKLGAKRTIARVRDPEYAQELHDLQKDLGLDMIINPEQQAALEMSRLLRFPTADDIETFVGGRVELVSFHIAKGDYLEGKQLSKAYDRRKLQILVVTVERNGKIFIPTGMMVFETGDLVKIMGRPSMITDFYRFVGINNIKIKDALIIGGGKITYYVADYLLRHKIQLKIIEIDHDKCLQLTETLPSCLIIQGDGTDEEILQSENIQQADAIVCLTDRDEENVMIALYAKLCGVPKAIVKINHLNLGLVKHLALGSVVCPPKITANQIVRYVRGLKNSQANDTVLTMHKIISSENISEHINVEALEFNVIAPSKCIDIPIAKLHLKTGTLIACIVRRSTILIPSGESIIRDGDNVIIITDRENIWDFDDILAPLNLFGGNV